MFIGLVLIAIGVIALLVKLGVLAGSIWSYFCPAVLIVLGLFFLLRPFSGRRSMWRNCCCGSSKEENKER